MTATRLPKTDSIRKLAEFWDTHDLADFDGDLVEVEEPVFARNAAIQVRLGSGEAEAVDRMAKAKGVTREDLIREWVLQKVARREKSRRTAPER